MISWVLKGLDSSLDDKVLEDDESDELTSTIHKLQAIYVQAQEAFHGGGKVGKVPGNDTGP